MRACSAKPRQEWPGRAYFCPQRVPPSSPALPTALPSLQRCWCILHPPAPGCRAGLGERGMQELPGMLSQPGCSFQGKSSKDERERKMLQLRSLQYLERYIFLILFNAYLHLEKKDSWQRPFGLWMREVRLSLAAQPRVYVQIQEFTVI